MTALRPELTEAILTEAAGEGIRRDLFCGDDFTCRQYILELESLGLLEARMGTCDRGESIDDVIITGITPLGHAYLAELRKRIGVVE